MAEPLQKRRKVTGKTTIGHRWDALAPMDVSLLENQLWPALEGAFSSTEKLLRLIVFFVSRRDFDRVRSLLPLVRMMAGFSCELDRPKEGVYVPSPHGEASIHFKGVR